MLFDMRKLDQLIQLWLDEDCNHYDLTAKIMVDDAARASFGLNAREDIILSGLPMVERVFRTLDPDCRFEASCRDGDRIAAGTTFATVTGHAQSLLTAERVALNLMQRMSGIAGLTADYVRAIEGTGAVLVDTRKTTPGLRMLEKYAVTCGGGRNHRLGLDNGIMLKDNHIAVAGSISAAVARAKAHAPILTKIEVECDRLEQVREALEAGADVIMLDNMSNDDMRAAVTWVAGRVPLECSGGVRLDTIRAKAETGVDIISVGRITQSAACVDIGLDEL
ncbi:carboxylating nicotinate-nucleotide diphosphorylase [Paracoccus zhejiangensis]|uniref:Probable nicotinate-nucleotide pyrophosphorylase [carboxylating] n=1 Tax=Paracoccus zhejiangensis TaxID=1077935 RepID=A0A2H5F4V6_9RHOB|nr:carboxylating nicotinate-nucleotide diphosphorylase [Paracoccus zhejiangensis]AUH66581.1 nicotinate-nucleotide diphosphorylase (carboxylating) [Paracoccus zhejiangensis]